MVMDWIESWTFGQGLDGRARVASLQGGMREGREGLNLSCREYSTSHSLYRVLIPSWTELLPCPACCRSFKAFAMSKLFVHLAILRLERQQNLPKYMQWVQCYLHLRP
jgi:hypothetical protein